MALLQIAVVGHSLGSVIMFDLMQKAPTATGSGAEIFRQFTRQEPLMAHASDAEIWILCVKSCAPKLEAFRSKSRGLLINSLHSE